MTTEIFMYILAGCMFVYIVYDGVKTRMKMREQNARLAQLRAEEARLKVLEWEIKTAGMSEEDKLKLALEETNADSFHIGRRDE